LTADVTRRVVLRLRRAGRRLLRRPGRRTLTLRARAVDRTGNVRLLNVRVRVSR
jgi:hypothetical protein